MKTMKKLFILVIIVCMPVQLAAFSLGSENHVFNPALLGTSSRTTLEVGAAGNAGFRNNYFSVTDFIVPNLEPVLVIDLDDLYQSVKDDGLQLNTEVFGSAHAKLQLFNIGVGGYAVVDGYANTTLPPTLFKLLAEGNEMDEPENDTGPIDSRVFAETGIYGGYRSSNMQIGVKVGQYVPVMYTDGAKYEFSYETYETPDEDDNVAKAQGKVSGNVYSVLDLDENDPVMYIEGPEDFLEFAGTKIDAGFIYAERIDNPLWGASLSVPVTPATAKAYELKGEVTITVKNPLGNFGDDESEDESVEVDETEKFEFVRDEHEPDIEIKTPIRVGGFYRVNMLPVFDLIPHVELVFDDPIKVNGGMMITGHSFPLSGLSLGMGYRNEYWNSSAALKVDLRLAEVGVQVSNSAREFSKVFSLTGPKVAFHAAVGL